jgi:hypothetical protein
MPQRASGTTVFQELTVEGWSFEIRGVRVVVDGGFNDEDVERICSRLETSLAALRPALLRPVREIVMPLRGPSPVSAGTVTFGTGQICLWGNRQFSDVHMPDTKLGRLEHESAHLLHPSGGAPDAEAWRSAIQRDRPGAVGAERLVVPKENLQGYPEVVHEAEDWAWAVEYLACDDRDPDGGHAWRNQRSHRARIIDQVLGAAI